MTATRLVAVAALAATLLAAGAATASPTQESLLMDDAEFVYRDAEHVDRRMAEAKALGFDRVRVSVYWRVMAPAADAQEKPASGYPASDPRFYGQGKWDRYDRIVSLAAKHGLGVLFSLTGPAPSWATGTPPRSRGDIEDTWDPSATEFREFVTAVGRRYSGTWQDEREEPALLPILPPAKVKSPPLPRVDTWSIWNEPNHGGWLTPQWNVDGQGRVGYPASPRIYRGLVNAAWAALNDSGHGADTILIGETAPRGLRRGLTRGIRPLGFVRELYCLNRRFRPYTGAGAEARGCPPDPAAFVAANPGLFAARGFAHHPYSLTTAPRVRDRHPENVTLSGMRRLTRTLDRAVGAYGQGARFPIWMTEYGYQTNPPDPTIGVGWSRQADWIDDATYLAYANRRIVSFAQFLLVDDGPIRQYPASDPRHWGTFQTGLMTGQGKHKPAYESFKRPITVSPRRTRRGRSVRVFGQLRPAADGQRLTAEVQFRRSGAKTWQRVARVTVGNPRGFLDTRVRVRSSGAFRIAWVGDGTSRAVSVRAR